MGGSDKLSGGHPGEAIVEHQLSREVMTFHVRTWEGETFLECKSTFVFRFFSHIEHYRVVSRDPCDLF